MKFTNGKVFDVYSGEFVTTDFCLEGTKFVENSADHETIDLTDRFVTPGLIDAHTHLGLWEENVSAEDGDGNEISDPITPHLRAVDAINPFDVAFEKGLKGGVTTVAAGPGSANIIGGQWTIFKTYGKSMDDMVISYSSAMKCAFGENPKRLYGKAGNAPKTRMAIAAGLRSTIMGTIDYIKRREASENVPFDAKYEAMIPVIKKEMPLKIHAHRADDILTAIRIVKEFDLIMSLEHGTESHLIVDSVKAAGIPVITGPTFGINSKMELSNKTFDTPRILSEAGVPFAIMTDHPVHPLYSLIMWATLAHKAGLKKAEALRAITLYPAQILNIDDRVGAIAAGKDADFVVWDKDPFDIMANVVEVWVDGKRVV